MVTLTKERIIAFDFIRFIAILLVVFSHFLKVPFDTAYLGILGNALFFFISGYLIHLNNPVINSKADILKFYKKRVLRIFPLYVLALLLFIIISTATGTSVQLFGNISDYSVYDVVCNFLGLQGIFYPTFIMQNALWFIGMILIYYLLYPIIMFISKQKILKYILFSIVAIGILVVLRVTIGLVEGGVFEYYFIFVAGVLASWLNIFKSKYSLALKIISFILFIPLTVYVFSGVLQGGLGEIEKLALTVDTVLTVGYVIFIRIVYGLTGAFVVYTIYNWFKFPKFLSKIIVSGAFAAYAVYLFHGQIFTLVHMFIIPLNEAFTNPLLYDLLFICVIVPIIFVLGYYLQKGENFCVKRIKENLSMKHQRN